MASQITEITRRDLREALRDVQWWGRLEEIEFLGRLYQLADLPSSDPRFKTAEDDIWQHRVNNGDWASDWVLTDDRFGLSAGEDEDLLRFLSEMLHPAVRKGSESELIVDQINPLLRADGYEIVQNGSVSGRPKYGWRRVDASTTAFNRHFTKDIAPLIATVSELARQDGDEVEMAVLLQGKASLEEPELDNWDGGSFYYTLTLTVPVPVFARLGDQTNSLEQRIIKRINHLQRGPDRHKITAVVIQPGMVRHAGGEAELTTVVTSRSQASIPQFWTPGQFRLFLSHVTSFKQRTAALRQSLARYHISAFVAHDTIEPGELWQKEIEAALRSMDAMAAILTPDFPQSRWTDQEVGWALGAGAYVVPIRRGLDPYGFLAEVQGIQGLNKTVSAVADEVFQALLKQQATRRRLLEALVLGFERSASSTEALSNVSLVERAGALPPALAQQLEAAVTVNSHASGTKGLRDRVQRIARAVSTAAARDLT